MMMYSITWFNGIEDVFLSQYTQPIAYHTLLTQFTQIHLEKNEKIREFNLNLNFVEDS
jgi:hypothetical protein